MIAVKLIILIGVMFTLFVIYSLVSFYFGHRVKTYLYNKKELREANKLIQQARDKKALEYKKSLEPEEVEAEEVGPNSMEWDVFRASRLGETLVSTELIVND